jgi:bacteriocin-like protein
VKPDAQQQQSTNISPQPDAENKKKQSAELSEEELKKVSGGNPSISEIPITKPIDKAS